MSVKWLNSVAKVLATVDMVLMKMSSATPTTSLRVSPTVSPTTAALWAGEPLPWPSSAPDSIYFMALSNAPPELPMNSARGMATMVAPTSKPPTNSTPNRKPPTMGISSAITEGSSMVFSA